MSRLAGLYGVTLAPVAVPSSKNAPEALMVRWVVRPALVASSPSCVSRNCGPSGAVFQGMVKVPSGLSCSTTSPWSLTTRPASMRPKWSVPAPALPSAASDVGSKPLPPAEGGTIRIGVMVKP